MIVTYPSNGAAPTRYYAQTLTAHRNCNDPQHPGCSNCNGDKEELIEARELAFRSACQSLSAQDECTLGREKGKLIEVLLDSLETDGGPTLSELLDCFIDRAVLGHDKVAKSILARMATAYAESK